METRAHRALVGLGSNLEGPLGGPGKYVETALERLALEPAIELTQKSGLYRSAPLGGVEQGDFINAVAEVSTRLDPLAFLDVLLSLETALGRIRAQKWGPRLIDLDVLSFDDLEIRDERLSLPHPRMHQRAFVLLPLLELDPDFVIPGKGPAREYLEKIGDSQRLEVL